MIKILLYALKYVKGINTKVVIPSYFDVVFLLQDWSGRSHPYTLHRFKVF